MFLISLNPSDTECLIISCKSFEYIRDTYLKTYHSNGIIRMHRNIHSISVVTSI